MDLNINDGITPKSSQKTGLGATADSESKVKVDRKAIEAYTVPDSLTSTAIAHPKTKAASLGAVADSLRLMVNEAAEDRKLFAKVAGQQDPVHAAPNNAPTSNNVLAADYLKMIPSGFAQRAKAMRVFGLFFSDKAGAIVSQLFQHHKNASVFDLEQFLSDVEIATSQ